jgi:hypothetical protein
MWKRALTLNHIIMDPISGKKYTRQYIPNFRKSNYARCNDGVDTSKKL